MTITTLFLLIFSIGLIIDVNAEEKKSRGVKSSCTLPSKNISLAALGENDYYTAENRDDQTVIYLSLCHPLRNLPPTVSDLCDKKAFVCITKLNVTSHEESEEQRNAGWLFRPPHLSSDGGHLQIIYENGGECVGSVGDNHTTTYSTWIDFFCSSDFAADNAIRYEGKFGNCASQVFWHTSLACLSGNRHTERETGSCLLKIPGYDTSLDLSSWASPEGYFMASSNGGEDKKRLFQLNLCTPVTNGACTNGTVVCEVDNAKKNLLANLIDRKHRRTLEYNEINEAINLKYEDSSSRSIEIEIKCDKSALKPEITLVSNSGTKFKFQLLTKSACLVPPVQCTSEDKDGDVFSLSMLSGIEWEIGVEDTSQKYAIKVCGSLPMSRDNPCHGQAGVCTYRESIGGNKTEPINLGLMRHKPSINDEDHSITMVYEGGDPYTDPILKNTCNRSAEITLICHDKERGPRVQLVKDPCKHELIWQTPAACPQKKSTVSKNCTVREPRWSYLFNLTSLYNSTDDHKISANGSTFIFNVCGKLLSDCSSKEAICFEHEKDLSYDDGTLVMRHTSTQDCPRNPGNKMTANIIFVCEHGQTVPKPRVSTSEDECQVEIEWRTDLACTPHEEVQCSLTTPHGLVDLSSLSLTRTNYQLQADGGGEFSINVCRSLVHSHTSHCPYKSAACFTKTVDGKTDSNNLGQLTKKGPQLGPEGKVFLSYKLGSVCLHPNDNRNHIETRIYFDCDETVTESEPQFIQQNMCVYTFHWVHSAACPLRQKISGNCSVTNPSSGFTFNLTSLRKNGENYHREGAYHHLNYDLEFNVCGPVHNSSCPPGSGICSSAGEDMGQANADLTIDDDQLSLVYKSGAFCQSEGQTKRNMETRINFICPQRRTMASGNSEEVGPILIKRNTKCDTAIEFYTDLACDHQVYCDVATGDTVYSLTKLRRHQKNYNVINSKPGEEDIFLNICGPLVPTDVPRGSCNSHGVCGWFQGRWQGFGRVQSSPYMGKNGHLVIDYTNGDICESMPDRKWQTQIIFTCDKTQTLSSQYPLGRPVHVSTSDCLAVFKFPSVLACNDTTVDTVIRPDTCDIFHPGTQKYVDIQSLIAENPYIIADPDFNREERYFEIQPCGSVASCKGAICSVHKLMNETFSLGSLNDFSYFPNLDSVRVRYTNGDVCNTQTKKRWNSKIYYNCDMDQGVGAPKVRETYDCLIIFDWRTSAFCVEPEDQTLPFLPELTWTENPKAQSEEDAPEAVGGVSWGMVFLSLLIIGAIFTIVLLYKRPEARERAIRMVQEARARMPVVLGGRGRDDSTLLVSNGRFGSLADDDDFS